MKQNCFVLFSIAVLLASSNIVAQDYLKLKSLPGPMKCYIIEVKDSTVTYQKFYSNTEFKALLSDIDWFMYEDGMGLNYSRKEITRSDLLDAYTKDPAPDDTSRFLRPKYMGRPLGLDRLFGIGLREQYSSKDMAPLVVEINAAPEKIFKVAAGELLKSGFMIIQSNSTLFSLTTDYLTYNPSFQGRAVESLFGAENFRIALSLLITPETDSTANLLIRGKIGYTLRRAFFEMALNQKEDFREDERTEVIRRGSESFNIINDLAENIRSESENRH